MHKQSVLKPAFKIKHDMSTLKLYIQNILADGLVVYPVSTAFFNLNFHNAYSLTGIGIFIYIGCIHPETTITDYIEFKTTSGGINLSMYKNSFNAFKNLSSGNVYPTTGDLNPSINQPKTKFRVRTELIPLLVRMGV